MEDKLAYVLLEVGGIQKFILGTGKLKEMLGGSELIESLSKNFLNEFCEESNLHLIPAQEAHCPAGQEVLTLQRNAGSLHLLFPSCADGKKFLRKFGEKILESYPGLPLFAALGECDWDAQHIRETKRQLNQKIAAQRNAAPTASGMNMQPICQAAGLDALPAVIRDGKEAISLPSQTRRIPKLLEMARERLRALPLDNLPEYVSVEWTDNLEELAGSQNKVAFIHIDGNDLGKLFRKRLEEQNENPSLTPEESISRMGALSELVEQSTGHAFQKAMENLLSYELKTNPRQILMPARPLVLGGDDVTAVVRADVALLFVDSFVKAFETKTAELGTRLSVGVGMVICPVGYPFLKAFALSEELLKNAKSLTADMTERPSSLDYLVITNDVEKELDSYRNRRVQAGEESLTCKPLILRGDNLSHFILDGIDVLTKLPRSAVRPVLNDCRKGSQASHKTWEQMRKNLRRGLGGRHDQKLMPEARFTELFPDGFFMTEKGRTFTRLGDYLELAHIMPAELQDFAEFLRYRMEGKPHA